jgi:hypothetical protein
MAPPFVLSIDWDFFVGDSSNDPCEVCRWNCEGPKKPDFTKRKDQTYQDRFFNIEHVKSPLKHQVLSQFHWPSWNGTPIIVADCHASLYRLLPHGAYIYNIDHHTDSDPILWDVPNQQLTCGSWGTLAVANKNCHFEWCHKFDLLPDGDRIIVTPECSYRWHKPTFVFICLSSPYVNPEYDCYFYQFVRKLSVQQRVEPQFIGLGAREMRRAYKSKRTGSLLTGATSEQENHL